MRVPRRRRGGIRSGILSAVGALLIGGALAWEVGPPLVGCVVKGNVSVNTGERIYHVPGQRYYHATRIELFKGERWFCSEADARAAGWRQSKV
jgi:hypothetical protein